jgi:hypothetical protein
MVWARHVARIDEMRYSYTGLVGKSERKRKIWKRTIRSKHTFKIDLRDILSEDGGRIKLISVGTAEGFNVG